MHGGDIHNKWVNSPDFLLYVIENFIYSAMSTIYQYKIVDMSSAVNSHLCFMNVSLLKRVALNIGIFLSFLRFETVP